MDQHLPQFGNGHYEYLLYSGHEYGERFSNWDYYRHLRVRAGYLRLFAGYFTFHTDRSSDSLHLHSTVRPVVPVARRGTLQYNGLHSGWLHPHRL